MHVVKKGTDMRKLATIRTIDRITPIEKADRLELAHIGGWQVVVEVDAYKPGDQVIFCEIDSALPVNNPGIDPSGQLAKRGTKTIDGEEYHVVKTIKLRGEISQGLILPLSILDYYLHGWSKLTAWVRAVFPGKLYVHGQDVSNILGIIKWDPYALKPQSKNSQGRPNIIGAFPIKFAQKSDSERIQNLTGYWPVIVQHKWNVTEKLDGQSITLINDGGVLKVASRNYLVAEHPAKNYALEHDFLNQVPDGWAVQGEWVGPGVNGNHLGLKEHRFYAFEVFNHGKIIGVEANQWAYDRAVPRLKTETSLASTTPEDLINMVSGMKSTLDNKRLAEGIVLRTSTGVTLKELGRRATFKVINNKYLLKNDE
ncbi:RNA ligase family protein [Corynebacterium pyruviciproducens]